MTDELVAYLLDDLDPERRAEVEQRLETDDAWQCELQRLHECFAATGDPAKCADGPPRDLVKRTCGLVDRARRAREKPPVGAAAFAAAPAHASSRGSWSFADVVVGGGVLVVLGMLLTPALRESRDASRGFVCQDNLRALGTALFDYQQNHARWLPSVEPGQNAGRFAVDLVDDAGLDRKQVAAWLLCPDSELAHRQWNGGPAVQIPRRAELDAASGRQLAQILTKMSGSYAYRVGYYDPRDQMYHDIRYTGDDDEPMLADAPRVSAGGIRTANHGGCGQYVLYQGLSVRYRANCDLASSVDNIFLNAAGQHAAGRNPGDVVLIRGEYGPDGPLTVVPIAR